MEWGLVVTIKAWGKVKGQQAVTGLWQQWLSKHQPGDANTQAGWGKVYRIE